jgi:hypothetical protein
MIPNLHSTERVKKVMVYRLAGKASFLSASLSCTQSELTSVSHSYTLGLTFRRFDTHNLVQCVLFVCCVCDALCFLLFPPIYYQTFVIV